MLKLNKTGRIIYSLHPFNLAKAQKDFTGVNGRGVRRRRKRKEIKEKERLIDFEREEYERANTINNSRYYWD